MFIVALCFRVLKKAVSTENTESKDEYQSIFFFYHTGQGYLDYKIISGQAKPWFKLSVAEEEETYNKAYYKYAIGSNRKYKGPFLAVAFFHRKNEEEEFKVNFLILNFNYADAEKKKNISLKKAVHAQLGLKMRKDEEFWFEFNYPTSMFLNNKFISTFTDEKTMEKKVQIWQQMSFFQKFYQDQSSNIWLLYEGKDYFGKSRRNEFTYSYKSFYQFKYTPHTAEEIKNKYNFSEKWVLLIIPKNGGVPQVTYADKYNESAFAPVSKVKVTSSRAIDSRSTFDRATCREEEGVLRCLELKNTGQTTIDLQEFRLKFNATEQANQVRNLEMSFDGTVEKYDKHTKKQMRRAKMGKHYFAVLLQDSDDKKAYINIYKYKNQNGTDFTYIGIDLYEQFKVLDLIWDNLDFEFKQIQQVKSQKATDPKEELLEVFDQQRKTFIRFKISETQFKFISEKDDDLRNVKLKISNILSSEERQVYGLFKKIVVTNNNSNQTNNAGEKGNQENDGIGTKDQIIMVATGAGAVLLLSLIIRWILKRQAIRAKNKKKAEETNLVYDLQEFHF